MALGGAPGDAEPGQRDQPRAGLKSGTQEGRFQGPLTAGGIESVLDATQPDAEKWQLLRRRSHFVDSFVKTESLTEYSFAKAPGGAEYGNPHL